MMVLKPGRQQRGWAAERECTGSGNGGGGCGALLLVEQGDLYQTSSGHYDGSCERYVTFRCSECGVETDVQGVPGQVVAELRARPGTEAAAREKEGT